MSQRSRTGDYLGTHSLHLSMPEVALFRDAVEYLHGRMPARQSIVNGSIVSALEGHFGDFHRTQRTHDSELFINPLMSMYWHFDLGALARRSLYLHTLEETESAHKCTNAAGRQCSRNRGGKCRLY